MTDGDIFDGILDALGRADHALSPEEIVQRANPRLNIGDVRRGLLRLKAERDAFEDHVGRWSAEEQSGAQRTADAPIESRSAPSVVEPTPQQWARPSGQTQDDLWASFAKGLNRPYERLPREIPLELLVAAHEWSLATPLAIRSKEDLKSLPRLNVDPYLHQVEAVKAFMNRLKPRGLIADDVGLGKTITVGIILTELMVRRRVSNFLVVAPKIVTGQWQQELATKFNISADVYFGAELKRVRRGDNVITTYQSAARYMQSLEDAGFDFLVLDEVHKLRNLHAPNPPEMAKRFLAIQTKRAFRFVVGLSATPLQNSLLDLFSVADVIRAPDPNPYGSKQHFFGTYVEDPPTCRHVSRYARDEFKRRTSEFMHRTSRKDARLQFPAREVRIERVKPRSDERRLYVEAIQSVVDGSGSAFEKINLAQTILSSPAAAEKALRSRAEKEKSGGHLAELAASIQSSAKLERLLQLVRALKSEDPDWRILVFTLRKETARFIERALDREGLRNVLAVVRGDQGDRANKQAVLDFVSSPPKKRVLVSTDAGAEGVNLQACNVVVNFDLPWNPMVLEQRIGRIQRLGQAAEKVIVYNLVTEDSVEDAVVSRLYEKLALYDATIGLAEEILGQLSDDEDSFETQIWSLVEKAVRKRDIEGVLREQQRNAEAAKRELNEQRRRMDEVLGALGDSTAPVRPPDISPVQPSVPWKEFWKGGMGALGWSLKPLGEGDTYEATSAGRKSKRFTFDAAMQSRAGDVILGAYGIELVAPEERAFEDVTRALTRYAQDATDIACIDATPEFAERLRALLGSRVTRVESIVLKNRRAQVRVEPIARVNSSVFHDQFDKTIALNTPIPLDCSLAADERANDALQRPEIRDAATKALRRAVASDPDFSAFRAFYDVRRKEEEDRIRRAAREGLDSQVIERQANDARMRLTTLDEARLVAWRGRIVEQAVVEATLALTNGKRAIVSFPHRGDQELEDALHVSATRTVCDSGHVVGQAELTPCSQDSCGSVGCPSCEEFATCASCSSVRCAQHMRRCDQCDAPFCPSHLQEVDGGSGCPRCIQVCAATGTHALTNRLVETQPGRHVLAELTAKCDDTGAICELNQLTQCAECGRRVVPTRLERSALTGQLAHLEHFKTCGETGVRALPSELGQCSVTGKYYQKHFLKQCDVSGNLAHPTALATSEVSGKQVLPSLLQTCAVGSQHLWTPVIHQHSPRGARDDAELITSPCAVQRERRA